MNFFKEYSEKLEKNAEKKEKKENSEIGGKKATNQEDCQTKSIESEYYVSPITQSKTVERIAKIVSLPYYESKTRYLEIEEYDYKGQRLKRIKNTVTTSPVNTTKLLLEMIFILDKKNNFLLEAKHSYIAYRYGLLGHMYTDKLLKYPVADAGKVVSKMLRGLEICGYEQCILALIEQPNNFMAFKNKPDFSSEQLKDMHEFTDSKDVLQQLITIGVLADQDVYTNYSKYCAQHTSRLEKFKVYIGQDEMQADINVLLSGSTLNNDSAFLTDVNDYLLNHKMPDGSSKYMSTSYRVINPEVFKLLMYLKPLMPLVDENSRKVTRRDNYEDPDKVFSALRGSIDLVKAKSKVLEFYNPDTHVQLDNRALPTEFDPFTHKSMFVKNKKPANLYAPTKKTYTQLVTAYGSEYMNPNFNIGDEQNKNIINPFSEYIRSVKGTHRETIALGLMAYPHEVWRKFCDLVYKHRGLALSAQVGLHEFNLLEELKLNKIHLIQEQIIHFYKELTKFSVTEKVKHYNVKESSWVTTSYNNSLCSLLFKASQILVSLGLREARDTDKLGSHTFRSFSIPRIRIRKYSEDLGVNPALFENLHLNKISKLTTINWDTIKGILDKKLPLLLYTVKPEAMAIVANHHDFAETVFDSNINEKNGYTLQNAFYSSIQPNYDLSSANYNTHFTTTILTKCSSRGRFGIYRAGGFHYMFKNPIQTIGYFQWFQSHAGTTALQRFQTQDHLYNYKRLANTGDVSKLRKSYRRPSHKNFDDEDICCTYATDPRFVLDNHAIRDTQVRSKDEIATRNKLIAANKEAKRKQEMYDNMVLENKKLSEEHDAVVIGKLDKDLNEIISKYEKNCEDIKKLEPEVTEYFQKARVAKSVVRADRIESIKQESIKILASSIITNYSDHLTEEDKEQCITASPDTLIQDTLEDLFQWVLRNPYLVDMHYKACGTTRDASTPTGNITVLDDPKHFNIKSQILTGTTLTLADILSNLFTCSMRFSCSVQEIYNAFKESRLHNDSDTTKAIQLTLHRTKHDNKGFGTKVFNMFVASRTSICIGLESTIDLMKTSFMKEAEEQQEYYNTVGVKQQSYIDIEDLRAFSNFVTDTFKITEPIFPKKARLGAHQAHDQMVEIGKKGISSAVEVLRLKKEVCSEYGIKLWHYEKWLYGQQKDRDLRFKKAVRI